MKPKILLINLQGLGDFLMITPLIKALSDKFIVDVLANNENIIKFSPTLVNKIYFSNGSILNVIITWIKIFFQRYDYIFLTNGAGPKSGFFFKTLINSKKICHNYVLKNKITSFNADISIEQKFKMHRIEENLKILPFINIKYPQKINYCLNFQEDKDFITKFIQRNDLSKKKLIGIHPGSDNNNPQKRYPIKKYCQLIDQFNESEIALFFIGPDEKELIKKIKQFGKKGKYLIIRQSIKKLMNIIKKCDYLIHSDSFIGHLAAALKVKTITIAGATNWYKTRPFGNHDKLLVGPNTREPKPKQMQNSFIEEKPKFIEKIPIGIIRNEEN